MLATHKPTSTAAISLIHSLVHGSGTNDWVIGIMPHPCAIIQVLLLLISNVYLSWGLNALLVTFPRLRLPLIRDYENIWLVSSGCESKFVLLKIVVHGGAHLNWFVIVLSLDSGQHLSHSWIISRWDNHIPHVFINACRSVEVIVAILFESISHVESLVVVLQLVTHQVLPSGGSHLHVYQCHVHLLTSRRLTLSRSYYRLVLLL